MSELLMHPMGGGTGSDDVTATAANVLSGKTAVTHDSDDEAIEGTMANNGAMDVTLTPAGSGTTSKAVAEGYYSGGTIKADGSAAYSAGHSQGVTDADARVNTASASYNAGYANGYNDGKWSVKNSGQNVTLTGVHGAYDDYTFTYQGRSGYNGVIFAITRADYWTYVGGSTSSASDAANITTSYNSSNGVITIHAYRHTKLVGTIYYY